MQAASFREGGFREGKGCVFFPILVGTNMLNIHSAAPAVLNGVPGSFFNTTLCRTGTKTGVRKHCLCNKTIFYTIFNVAFIFVDHVDTKYMCRFSRSLQE